MYTVAASRFADWRLKGAQLNKQLSQHEERLCQTTIRPLTHTHVMGISHPCSCSLDIQLWFHCPVGKC